MRRLTRWIIAAGLLSALIATVLLLGHLLSPWFEGQYRIHPKGSVLCMAFSPDGKILALGGPKLKLWDVASRKVTSTIEGHSAPVSCVAFSPDGKLLASGSDDHTVKLWEMPGRKEVATLERHTGRVWSVAFSPDGKTLASGASEKPILRLWDVASGKQKTDLRIWVDDEDKQQDVAGIGRGEVLCVAFSPDGKVLAFAKGGALLTDLATGKVSLFSKDLDGVHSLAYSPDGKWLVAGNWNGVAKSWEAASGKELNTYRGAGNNSALMFSPDSTLLVGYHGEVTLWDINTGRQRAEIRHGYRNIFGKNWSSVTAAAFSPDGQTLVTGSINGTIMFWKVEKALKDSK